VISTKHSRVVWDILPEDFNQNGHLQKLINSVKESDFEELVETEIQRTARFLEEWEKQLLHENQSAAIPPLQSQEIDLTQLFRKTPQLSGVIYLSHNYVMSEALFEEFPQNKRHLTDRVVHERIQQHLPAWQDLTFSFPRQYKFDGFYNSWGFVRIERSDAEINGKAVLLSVNTLDPHIMALMKKHEFTHLAELYNRAWDGAIHDYIHHIALYTNPSFGIGKLSPMSLADEHHLIDGWGSNMLDTFNYEYWAHFTHRLITEKVLTQDEKEKIISHAIQYFNEVSVFLSILLKDHSIKFVQRVSNYLVHIYLWPIHVLLHSLDPLFEKLIDAVGQLQVDFSVDLRHEAAIKMQLSQENEKTPDHPRVIALKELVKGLRLHEKIENPSQNITWLDLMRLSVDMIVQRGVYEKWFHHQHVLYKNTPTHPHIVMLHMIKILSETFPRFMQKQASIQPYTLKGIVP